MRAVRKRDRHAPCSCNVHGGGAEGTVALYVQEAYNVLMHVLAEEAVLVVQEWPLRTKDARGRYRKGCNAHADLALFVDKLCIVVEVHGSPEHHFCSTCMARVAAKKAAIQEWPKKSCNMELLVVWAPHLWPVVDGGPVAEVAWPDKMFYKLFEVVRKHGMVSDYSM